MQVSRTPGVKSWLRMRPPTSVVCGDAVGRDERRGPSILEGLIQWGDERG